MGFMDKAKKMAEQAQAKLDEVQGQINSKQGQPAGGGPVVEYDKHGRPIQPAPVTPDAAPRRRRPWRPPACRQPSLRGAAAAPARRPTRPRRRPRGRRRAAARRRGLSERRSAGGLTLRECASCAPTKAC